MFYEDTGKHNRPHFHAKYGDEEAQFALDGTLLSGEMPFRQKKFIEAWALLREEELAANWELAVNNTALFRIEGLK